MSVDLTLQEQGHRTWAIIRLFYLSLIGFRDEFERYERLVEGHARALGVDRKLLRLSPRELAELLEVKNLERLRDGYILKLKDLCHLVFRTEDQTDWLDRFVSDIFHEISILKEEHYTLKTYAPMYERDAQEVELSYIVDTAHTMFPQKLRHIRYLFGKARDRLEKHLPTLRSMPIVIRSLYLHRDDDFVRDAYPGGLRDFYRFIYTLGPFEGFYQVAQSFYHSGFFGMALEAFVSAEKEYREALDLYAQMQEASAQDAADSNQGDSNEAKAEVSEGDEDANDGGQSTADEYTRDPRLTLRSIRAKVARIRKRLAQADGSLSSREIVEGEREASESDTTESVRPQEVYEIRTRGA